jgi:phytoene synthase
MPLAKRQAIWAIYVWCRRTDELVDGPQAESTTLETLERWEQRLESIFSGNPQDDLDVALVHTLTHFPLDIQPFREMIAGQRMDLSRQRYETFDDLYLYCYRVAGTVGLMVTAIMGVEPPPSTAAWHPAMPNPEVPLKEAIALGVAKQLTNILRDVGEDARRGRIYLPLAELEQFGYTEADLLNGVNNERWQQVMQFQIQRARDFYAQAEQGVRILSTDARLPIWTALLAYRQILDVIEHNQYDVFQKRAFVSNFKKLLCIPTAFTRAIAL